MAEQYKWLWNEKSNLCGFDERGGHKFTWQPHGAQFTIVEEVPPDRVAIRVKQPPAVEPTNSSPPSATKIPGSKPSKANQPLSPRKWPSNEIAFFETIDPLKPVYFLTDIAMMPL